jgi:FtsP/CotA-like multicopper oxidase with cupredoxin domain
LTNNPLPDGYPWGKLTATGNNPYHECPHTGVTRHFEFNISRGYIAPDGYLRDVLLVNGAYPGPLIEANWGDTIVVKVNNNITGPEEGTAIHWHGFLQHDTPWEDGAPGISQCPVTPKRSYSYEFTASLYGSSWYHAHYSAQYTGGVVGPIVVHGPTHEEYDIDVGPIMLSGESGVPERVVWLPTTAGS